MEKVLEQSSIQPNKEDEESLTVLRVSTGINHNDAHEIIKKIVDQKNELNINVTLGQTKVWEIDSFLRLIDRLYYTVQKIQSIKKVDKSKYFTDLETLIAKYNKKLTYLQGHYHLKKNTDVARFDIFPFINTKKRNSKGKKNQLLAEGLITFPEKITDKDHHSIVLCKTRNKMCLVMDKPDLYNWLSTELEKHDKFQLITHMNENDRQLVNIYNEKNINHIIKLLAIKCPNCKDKNIKISKFWPHISRDNRNIINQKIWAAFGLIMIQKHESKLGYCLNQKCRYAHHGIMIPKIYEMKSETSIFCKECGINHGVHAHKVKCPAKGCQTTFCNVCKTSPYHDKEVCQGPIDDLDPLILKTTRPCPECGIRSEKSDGCDRMKCGNCQSNWCWRCLQKLDKDDPYLHNCLPDGIVDGVPDGVYRDYGIPREMYEI